MSSVEWNADATFTLPRNLWRLDPEVVFLNHGSFGACPKVVLEAQDRWRERMERQPVRFLGVEIEGLLDEARRTVGAFVGADPDDLAFVPNATAGVNTVLRSLRFEPGDEILTTNHEYNACLNALRFVCDRSGAKVVVADVPLLLGSPAQAAQAVLERLSPRTRLVMISHVTSPTALIFPVEQIVREAQSRGVDVLVDGAHAPGMIPLDLESLGAAYYTGNCHKWMCSPKGAAILHVRRDRQDRIRPLSISHGANATRTDRSRFRLEADWTGTWDPSAYLSVPAAIEFIGAGARGGAPGWMRANRQKALAARRLVCAAVGVAPPTPEEMIGSMAVVPLPGGPADATEASSAAERLKRRLLERHRVEIPVIVWPSPRWFVRLSAQAYNTREDYERLAEGLVESLAAIRETP